MKAKILISIILAIVTTILIASNSPKVATSPNKITQMQSNVITTLYKVREDTVSTNILYPYYTAGGVWFFFADQFVKGILKIIPQNNTHWKLDYDADAYGSSLVESYTVERTINMPGQQVNVLLYPIEIYPDVNWKTQNVVTDYIVAAMSFFVNESGLIEPGICIGGVTFKEDPNTGKDWSTSSISGCTYGALFSEGITLAYNASKYDFTKAYRMLYALPSTYYSAYAFSNTPPAGIIFDNMILYDTASKSYKVYTLIDIKNLEQYGYSFTEASHYIIKYVDSAGQLQNDTAFQKIPLLYLYSPLGTVADRHLDLLFMKVKDSGKIQFYLSGVFFYDPSDASATVDNKVRVIYDIPGVSPGATCYISQDYQILPTTMNPYTTKAYILTESVKMDSYYDSNLGKNVFYLTTPIRLALYDKTSRILAIIRINNVTLTPRDNIVATDKCHYTVQNIDVTLEKVYDLSGIIPNDQAADITMFDLYSPRVKYYGTLFFRVGTYDSVANYNPAKIVTYRETASGPELYIIDGQIQPLATRYRDYILDERMVHTWYGSPLLVYTQSDYNGLSVTKVVYTTYIVTPMQNITATPRLFTHTIEYNYTVTPIEITYIKYNPDEPDTLTNVLVLLNITDPTILNSIATSDARDVRFFPDNTRGGDYWKDVGYTYGIEEFIPGQRLVVYVLIPNLYANQTMTIYMYSGFPYAQPVAESVDSLLAKYPVLVPTSS